MERLEVLQLAFKTLIWEAGRVFYFHTFGALHTYTSVHKGAIRSNWNMAAVLELYHRAA